MVKNKKQILCMAMLLSMTMICSCGKPDSATGSSGGSTTDGTPPTVSAALEATELNASYTINADTSVLDESYDISQMLYGIFIEDINHAVDGGMYAELVKNRSFEYGASATNENRHGWSNHNPEILNFEVTDGSETETNEPISADAGQDVKLDAEQTTGMNAGKGSLNVQNPHYAVLTNTGAADEFAEISNGGYLKGMAVTAGAVYDCTFYARTMQPVDGSSGYEGAVEVTLKDSEGTVYAAGMVSGITMQWQKFQITLTPTETVNAGLSLYVGITPGTVCLDMISLMPQDTYHGTGVREEIGEYLEALNPSFVRFPGGCVIEGSNEETMYSWKDSIGYGMSFAVNGEETIGDVAVRPQGKSIWAGTKADPYYTTYGIGFYEFFNLCDELGAMPVPVLNAGMTCEVQSPRYIVYDLDSDEFRQCIQDALDLVEFCLGGEDTYWGGVRIAMGHLEPFDLQYIAIGNEQWQSEYYAHYQAFVEAFTEAAAENPELYGGVQLCVANGTASGSSDGWNYIAGVEDTGTDSLTTLVDEHYYESPTWFLTNTTRYDAYSRDSQAEVFLGEYAAQSNNWQAALAEAAYMTGLERNADIVKMACYAPLFANDKANQWTPDLIWYSNYSCYGSVNYYVQQMFANNLGTTILPATLDFPTNSATTKLSGAVGLGTWMTKASYDNLVVTDNASGTELYRCTFDSEEVLETDAYQEHEGSWSVENGRLLQSNVASPADTNTGDAIYVGDPAWTDYTMTVEAEIIDGQEGFLIPVCVTDEDNHIFWNVGGWGNSVSCLQIVSGGSKSGQVSGTVKSLILKKNQVYQLKVVVSGNNLKCYLDDVLYVDYTYASTKRLYETTSMAENGDIIVKLVNAADLPVKLQMSINGVNMADYESEAEVTVLSGNAPGITNTAEQPENIVPVSETLAVSGQFPVTVKPYTVMIIRIPVREE